MVTLICSRRASQTDNISLGVDSELRVLKQIGSIKDSVVNGKNASLRGKECQVARLTRLENHSMFEIVCYREPMGLGGVIVHDMNDYVPVNSHIHHRPRCAMMLTVIVSG